MKKQSKRKPRPVNANAFMRSIQGVKPLTQDERKDFWNNAHQNTMRELVEREILVVA